jgi:hypothetical protein
MTHTAYTIAHLMGMSIYATKEEAEKGLAELQVGYFGPCKVSEVQIDDETWERLKK